MSIIITRNSTYEFDYENKRFRRLGGKNQSVLSVADGEWVSYTTLYPSPPEIGQCVYVDNGEFILTPVQAIDGKDNVPAEEVVEITPDPSDFYRADLGEPFEPRNDAADALSYAMSANFNPDFASFERKVVEGMGAHDYHDAKNLKFYELYGGTGRPKQLETVDEVKAALENGYPMRLPPTGVAEGMANAIAHHDLSYIPPDEAYKYETPPGYPKQTTDFWGEQSKDRPSQPKQKVELIDFEVGFEAMRTVRRMANKGLDLLVGPHRAPFVGYYAQFVNIEEVEGKVVDEGDWELAGHAATPEEAIQMAADVYEGKVKPAPPETYRIDNV